MIKYEKIPNVFERDIETNKLIEGNYSSDEVAYLSGLNWSCTEKIDGTNIGIVWDGYSVCYQGRTEKALIPNHLLDRLKELFDDKEEIFEQLFGDKEVILFGEGFGAKIQTGGSYLGKDVDFILFDIYLPDSDLWLKREDIVDIADKLNIRVVPEVFVGPLAEAVKYVKSNPKSTIGTADMEGVVAKPVFELRGRFSKRIVVKIKCCDYR